MLCQNLVSRYLNRVKFSWIVSIFIWKNLNQVKYFLIESNFDNIQFSFFHVWIDSNYIQSYYKNSLTLIESIHKNLNRVNLHPGIFESIQNLSDAYQSSWFILLVILLFESIHTLIESIQYVVFDRNIALATLFYIYSLPRNTQIIESFAFILSRVSKPHCPYILQD